MISLFYLPSLVIVLYKNFPVHDNVLRYVWPILHCMCYIQVFVSTGFFFLYLFSFYLIDHLFISPWLLNPQVIISYHYNLLLCTFQSLILSFFLFRFLFGNFLSQLTWLLYARWCVCVIKWCDFFLNSYDTITKCRRKCGNYKFWFNSLGWPEIVAHAWHCMILITIRQN